MNFFFVEPEVAGRLGERSVLDRSVHPPVVKRLHYELDGWLGDALIESFPAFVITKHGRDALLQVGATGGACAEVELTVSTQFTELYPQRKLPTFFWLRPEGVAGQDDVGAVPDGRLVLSQRALDALRPLGIQNALIEPF